MRGRRTLRPARVAEVREDSPCRGLVKEGDLLLSVNGERPRDVIDYMHLGYPSRVRLRLRRGDRELRVTLRKEEGLPLGLVFEEPVFDGVITCRSRCLFCFVDQMPPGMRPSLYLKDDDYRLSFLQGNFVTLNNLGRAELRRILDLRLSPLYVSLHTTDPHLRTRLMGKNGNRGLEALRVLLRAGLEVHLQVVCCPGLNDGEALTRTFRDVLREGAAASLGVVPVGLTRLGAERTPGIRPHDAETASRVLDTVEEFQGRALELLGRRLFHASDEFYLLAGRDFPGDEEYEGYPQLENGVGMARKFLEEAARLAQGKGGGAEVRTPQSPMCVGLVARKGAPGVITGEAGKAVLERALSRAGVSGVDVLAVENRLFGGTVTVTSLLGGSDLEMALREEAPSCRELVIPETLLREGRFLDDLTPEDIRLRTGYCLRPLPVRGDAFISFLTTGEPRETGEA